MASPVFELLRSAIQTRRQVACVYTGHQRVTCPHTLGYSRSGIEMVLTYQFAGSSSRGLPLGGEWRCFEVAAMRSVVVQDGPWHTKPNHTRPQTCVARVIEEVAF